MASHQPPAAPPAITDAMPAKRPLGPFRRAVLRGLGVLMAPLLTIVIFLWVGNTVTTYLLEPLERGSEWVLVTYGSDIRARDEVSDEDLSSGRFTRVGEGKKTRYIPSEVYDRVEKLGGEPMPTTATGVYRAYVRDKWLQPWIVVPIFLSVFVFLLYLFGKFLAIGIGRFFWNQFEQLINRVPLVRNVYSSVKQVTDFLFTDPDLEYTRVVAIEYPRKGIWTVAFVTGESMLDIESAANEPVMSVLIPTSPMPFTGFTITVKKSETIDLNLSVDQAFQFIVSCGVVVPPQQLTTGLAKREAQAASTNGAASNMTERMSLAARTSSTGADPDE